VTGIDVSSSCPNSITLIVKAVLPALTPLKVIVVSVNDPVFPPVEVLLKVTFPVEGLQLPPSGAVQLVASTFESKVTSILAALIGVEVSTFAVTGTSTVALSAT
jgi:hypothetical protein